LTVAPVAVNPVMARLAEDTGFKAIYLSGGALGWLKCVTEANLSLADMAQVALDIRAVSKLPIVLDAGGGWGEPDHMHRTIAMTEAAGFAAVELEDQYLPRRVQHHIGEENLIEPQQMIEKIRDPDELRKIAERLPPPLMMFAPQAGSTLSASHPTSKARLSTAFAAMYKAVRDCYAALTRGDVDPLLGPGGAVREMKLAHETTGLSRLLDIEKRTTKHVG
jgi:hypothetical protein